MPHESLNYMTMFSGKNYFEFDVCLSVHRCICVEKKNQLDATEWFIALIIRSTYFGHFYAHHQELETTVQHPSSWTHSLLPGA